MRIRPHVFFWFCGTCACADERARPPPLPSHLHLARAARTPPMIIPMQCFTCGKMLSHKWNVYAHQISTGKNPATVLDELGFRRYCCRRMMLTNVDLTQKSMETYITQKEILTLKRQQLVQQKQADEA